VEKKKKVKVSKPKAKAKVSKPKEKAKPAKKASEVYSDSKYGFLKSDNLQLVEGIGPKINQLLSNDGIVTWRQLANAKVDRIKRILTDAGPRFKMHNPGTWPQQSALAADGKWEKLIKLQKELGGGKVGASNSQSDSKLEKILIKKGKR